MDQRNRNIEFLHNVLNELDSPFGDEYQRRIMATVAELMPKDELQMIGGSGALKTINFFEPGRTIYDQALSDFLPYLDADEQVAAQKVPFAYADTAQPNGLLLKSESGEFAILLDFRFDLYFNRLTPVLFSAFGITPPFVVDTAILLPAIFVVYAESFWQVSRPESFFKLKLEKNASEICTYIQSAITYSILSHELAHFRLGHLDDGPDKSHIGGETAPGFGREFDADRLGCDLLVNYYQDRSEGDFRKMLRFCYFSFFSGLYLFEKVERVEHFSHPPAIDRMHRIDEMLGFSERESLPKRFLDECSDFIVNFRNEDPVEMALCARKLLEGCSLLDQSEVRTPNDMD